MPIQFPIINSAVSYLRRLWPLLAATALSAQTAQVLETKTITPAEEPYAGWSTVARRANGELWVTWSGGRDGHVCPMGQVRAMTSRDDGDLSARAARQPD